MQKFITAVVILGIVCFLSSGCASIVSKSQWPVTINSNPSGATVTIKDSKGFEKQRGITPMSVILPSKAGFFQPATYQFAFEKDGYYPANSSLSAHLNGWYWGNVVFGVCGVIGGVVDPATGAMWKLDDMTYGNLSPNPNTHVNAVILKGLPPQVATTNKDISSEHFSINDFRIVEYSFDDKTGNGNVTVDIGNKGFEARLWVVKNIGVICSSKKVALDAGNESFSGAKYTILDESIKDGLLKITFQAVY